MSGMQTRNGKAFGYACLNAVYKTLSASQDVVIETTKQLETAHNLYTNAPNSLRSSLDEAANAASRVVIRLEPQLSYPDGNSPLFLSLQSDAKGIAGDVRDLICIRNQNNWEIGLSCKHNHRAVKHSRLSSTIDFGRDWFGIPCTKDYFSEIAPIFEELRTTREQSNATALWSDIVQKNERFYLPVLTAFMDEMHKLNNEHPNKIPELLIRYLIGQHDFYKVITNAGKRTTRIEGINLYGSLNRPSGGQRALANVPKLQLPTRFYDIGLKPGSQTSIEVVCDRGWTISMRIHNASSRIEPSLKFDVNLVSLPVSIYAQDEPW